MGHTPRITKPSWGHTSIFCAICRGPPKLGLWAYAAYGDLCSRQFSAVDMECLVCPCTIQVYSTYIYTKNIPMATAYTSFYT